MNWLRFAIALVALSSLFVGCGASDSILFDGDQLSGESTVDVTTYRFDNEDEPTGEFGEWTGFDRDDADSSDLSRLLTLVVVYATGTESVSSAFERMQNESASTHFLIGPRGDVFQVLDLVYSARSNTDYDTATVAIHLVNPLPDLLNDPEMIAACEAAVQAEPTVEAITWHEHHCLNWIRAGFFPSHVLEINGQDRRSMAFTEAQHLALIALLGDLGEQFPGLTDQLPTTLDGAVINRVLVLDPAEGGAPFRGVVAEWHLDGESWAPGPGLDWAFIKEGLAAPRED